MRHKRYAILLAVVALAAACSGEGTPTTTTVTDTPAVATTEPTSTTAPPATTTTLPELAPTGTVWVDTPVIADRAGLFTRAVRDIDGTRWIVGSEHNTIFLARSVDGGAWEEIRLEEPDRNSRAGSDILAGRDGRLIVLSTRGSDCQTAQPIDGGFHVTGMCQDGAGSVHISDDGGDTWRRVDPDVMNPSGTASYSFASAVSTDDGFAVAATINDSDWHTVLLTSTDGETWTRAARMDGTDGPLSAVSLHHDGEAYVLHAHEHPCPAIFRTTPGWILGSNWLEHGRFYEGASLDALTLHTPASLPIVAGSAEVDCATFDFTDNDLDYPTWTMGFADGVVTVVDITTTDDQAPETYRVARRSGDGWDVVEVPSQAAATGSTGVSASTIDVIDHPHGAALVEVLDMGAWGRDGYRLAITPIGDPDAAVMSETVFDLPAMVGWRVDGDAIELASFVGGQRSAAVHLLRSEPSQPGMQTCFPGPGANCLAATLSDVVTDLAGADLRGIRLRFADLSGVDFTGADLTGADLRNTRGSIRWEGSNLTNAVFSSSQLRVEGWPRAVAGASIDNSTLDVSWPSDAGDDWTMTLDGIRLLSAGKIRGDGRLLPISSTVGTEINAGSLERVDLTGTDLGGMDLTWVGFDEESVCPDGSAPFERSFALRCDP